MRGGVMKKSKSLTFFLIILLITATIFTLTACDLFGGNDDGSDNDTIIDDTGAGDGNNQEDNGNDNLPGDDLPPGEDNNDDPSNPPIDDPYDEDCLICLDKDNNHMCDICGTTLTTCADLDNNHKCDICDEEVSTCIDEGTNHLCDICGTTLTTCADLDNNHKCDICKNVLSECIDVDDDTYCDICNAKMYELTFTLLENGTYEVTKCTGAPTNVVIPALHNNIPVTSIGESAFLGDTLKSVVIPNTVEYIGEKAFFLCDELTIITFGNSIKSIAYCAFGDCYNLEKVDYLASLEDWCDITFEEINANPIYLNAKLHLEGIELVELVIPNSITEMKDYAFFGYNYLTNVYIGESIVNIGERVFDNCDNLISIVVDDKNKHYCDIDGNLYTKDGSCLIQYAIGKKAESFIIPSMVKSIGISSFNSAFTLKSIEIPDDIEYIGDYAFGRSNSLSYNTKNNIEYLGNARNPYVVAVNVVDKTLSQYTIEEGCRFIYNDAFRECEQMVNVMIPATVKGVGTRAFYSCRSLASVVIPESVSFIGDDALSNCADLVRVTIKNPNVEIGGRLFNYFHELEYLCAPIRVFESISMKYLKEIVITSGNAIASNLFYNSPDLTCVTMSNTITSIGKEAFWGCTELKTVNYLGTIGEWCGITFDNNTSNPLSYGANLYINGTLVKDLIIQEGVTEIKAYAFSGCSTLTSITIPSSIINIGDYAFYECDSLKKVNYLGAIEDWCRINHDGYHSNPLINGAELYILGVLVTDLIIPESVTEINHYAFNGCSSITSITIHDAITSIGNAAFNGCDFITTVKYLGTIEDWCNIKFVNRDSNPLHVGANFYLNDTLVTDLVIPDSVTRIYAFAFAGCSSIKSVTMSNTVNEIGMVAFGMCVSLISIRISESMTLLDLGLFFACFSLDNVIIPNSLEIIYPETFKGCVSLSRVYYEGTAEEWNQLEIAVYNDELLDATCYYYSETKPVETGNYWRYVDGEPVAW